MGHPFARRDASGPAPKTASGAVMKPMCNTLTRQASDFLAAQSCAPDACRIRERKHRLGAGTDWGDSSQAPEKYNQSNLNH